MTYHNSPDFPTAIAKAGETIRTLARKVETERWQGMDIKNKPGMATWEVLNYSLQVPIHSESLGRLREDVRPNLPWADDHFLERVGGEPLNPGVQWANWPFAASADRFREGENRQFSHTYMERMWPRFAAITPEGRIPEDADLARGGHYGHRCRYGDLNDLVQQLAREPDTRQGYLPLWFPEDTGVIHGGRVPCTLGYQFILRHGFMHGVYFLRSCDYTRHFRDDIYLCVRLMLWVMDQCRGLSSTWRAAVPGTLTMHITSFHVFENDYQLMLRKPERQSATAGNRDNRGFTP